MALIKCPECDQNVSENASSCPGCGQPIKAPTEVSHGGAINTKDPVHIVGILIAIVLVGYVANLLFRWAGAI